MIPAPPATVDGATTNHYLIDWLKLTGCVVTRLAQGVLIGGALDALDDGTLAAAFKAGGCCGRGGAGTEGACPSDLFYQRPKGP